MSVEFWVILILTLLNFIMTILNANLMGDFGRHVRAVMAALTAYPAAPQPVVIGPDDPPLIVSGNRWRSDA